MANKKKVVRITEEDVQNMILSTAAKIDEGKFGHYAKQGAKALATGLAGAGLSLATLYGNEELHKNDKEDPNTAELRQQQRDILDQNEFDDYHKNDTANWPGRNEGIMRLTLPKLNEIVSKGVHRLMEISDDMLQGYMDGRAKQAAGQQPLSRAQIRKGERDLKRDKAAGYPCGGAVNGQEYAMMDQGNKASQVMQNAHGRLKPTNFSEGKRKVYRMTESDLMEIVKEAVSILQENPNNQA